MVGLLVVEAYQAYKRNADNSSQSYHSYFTVIRLGILVGQLTNFSVLKLCVDYRVKVSSWLVF